MAELPTLPPVELNDATVAKIADQIVKVPRHHNGWPFARLAACEARNRRQRWPMKMVKMGVRDQHGIDRRQIAKSQARTAQPLENEDPLGEVRVNQDVPPSDLEEEAGVSDEGYAELAAPRRHGFARNSRARRHGRVAHQLANLLRLVPNGNS